MNSNFIYPNYMKNNSKIYYPDNFLSINKGKNITMYVSFQNSKEWKDTIFKGIIIDSNDLYTLLKDINSGNTIMVYNTNIDYIIFNS